MEQKVVDYINKEQLIKQNSTCIVGVSGGPDSMALLHLLWQYRDKYNLRIIAVTINHMLRDQASEGDVAYVKEMCAKWDVEFVAKQVDVGAYKAKHMVGTQIAARTLRYEVYKQQVERFKADYVALGHHGDDQVETIIMGLTRTTNLHAMTGIPLRRQLAEALIIRPLLVVSKEEIEQYCSEFNIQARLDASNEDTTYTRNDIRANVVPHLKRNNRNLHMTMQLLSESLKDDEKYIMEMAKNASKELIYFDENQKVVTFSIKSLNAYSVALQRRLYRLVLNYLYEKLPAQLSHMHEEIFLNLYSPNGRNKVVDFPNELKLERAYDQAKIYFLNNEVTSDKLFHLQINEVPSELVLPNGRTLQLTYTEFIDDNRVNTYIFSKDQVEFPLHIRQRRPGDRMRWRGLKGSKKLQRFFIDEKIPRNIRDQVYLLTDNKDEIMWLVEMKKGMLSKDRATGPYVKVEYKTSDC